ncbi:MAG: YrhA family protein [Alphaproteobacteria bacterium]|nr:YrhA family protein [Alphaproteobacteria bacterium]
MLDGFLKYLSSVSYQEGEPLESEALIVAQKVLHNMGLDFIPPTYVAFLKHHNGIKANGCYLFGATVDDELDIIDQNEQLPRPEKTILLGCNEFDLFGYNYEKKIYQIIDREDFEILESYAEDKLEAALGEIFQA